MPKSWKLGTDGETSLDIGVHITSATIYDIIRYLGEIKTLKISEKEA
jgi:hypothetical protein